MSDVEMSELDRFRREVHRNLAVGPSAESDLPVVGDDGRSQVVVALEDERLAVLMRRVEAVGGYANVFVRCASGTYLLAFLDPSGAIDPASADDMTGAGRPSAEASVGLFVEYLRARPDGVRLPKSLAADRAPQMVRAKTEPAFT